MRRLYVVAVSHLDTQWRWTLRDTITRHLPKTLRQNFRAFARHPAYVLSFDGAFRYALIEEYFPADFERLREQVRLGRWAPVGSMLDAADVNLPSPESIIRQILYGNRWFERHLGRRCSELFLPDCFGFGFALPSIAAHCGLIGFSSQKLSKGRAAAEIPFALGRWEGPDGNRILAALRPGGYGEPLRVDLATDEQWLSALDQIEASTGVPVALAYYGVGDTGGALDDESLRRLDQAVDRPDAPVHVLSGAAGRVFEELAPEHVERLPVHRGELLLSLHATGCYTSQAAMKRWNRMNEQLADAAERASLVARLLCGAPYPREALTVAWTRFLVHQFHDDLPGTSLPSAYCLSWNDEVLALNQFADLLGLAVGAVAAEMDTAVEGHPLLVFNPLASSRRDPVEIQLPSQLAAGGAWEVVDGDQVLARATSPPTAGERISFDAEIAPLGYKILSLRRSAAPATVPGRAPALLENQYLRVALNDRGDVSSLFDKSTGRELLAAPIRLETLPDDSYRFPSWEILYECVQAEPEPVADSPTLRWLPHSPAGQAVEISRQHRGSDFRLLLRLGASARRLEFSLHCDWATTGRLLKVRFPFATPEPRAIYDLGLGAIERPPNTPSLYEVPAQQWAAIESGDASFGIAVLNDSKHGWDRPSPGCLRLSLVHTPRIGRRFRYQRHQDFGPHSVRFAVFPYQGRWSAGGQVPTEAARFNQPLRAFFVPPHPGRLGRSLSPLRVSDPRVAVRALKATEDGDDVLVRLQETSGQPVSASIFLDGGIETARRLTGSEEALASEPVAGPDEVAFQLRGFEPRTLALAPRGAPPLRAPNQRKIALPFDLRATTGDGERWCRGFDGLGHAYPAELWPTALERGGVTYALGGAFEPNAVRCRGQALALAAPGPARILLLAAALGGHRHASFRVGSEAHAVTVPDWSEHIGQWARRGWLSLQPPRLERIPVLWNATHRHWWGANEPYQFCYLFRVELSTAQGASTLILPRERRIAIFAVTAIDGSADEPARAAAPLYD